MSRKSSGKSAWDIFGPVKVIKAGQPLSSYIFFFILAWKAFGCKTTLNNLNQVSCCWHDYGCSINCPGANFREWFYQHVAFPVQKSCSTSFCHDRAGKFYHSICRKFTEKIHFINCRFRCLCSFIGIGGWRAATSETLSCLMLGVYSSSGLPYLCFAL